jgi:acylphosphatase
MLRKRFEVTGLVQGVGFRMWLAGRAGAIGVRGTVRNRHDGAVEVEAGGTADQLQQLAALLRQGPPHSSVRKVRELPASAGALPPGFEITPG